MYHIDAHAMSLLEWMAMRGRRTRRQLRGGRWRSYVTAKRFRTAFPTDAYRTTDDICLASHILLRQHLGQRLRLTIQLPSSSGCRASFREGWWMQFPLELGGGFRRLSAVAAFAFRDHYAIILFRRSIEIVWDDTIEASRFKPWGVGNHAWQF